MISFWKLGVAVSHILGFFRNFFKIEAVEMIIFYNLVLTLDKGKSSFFTPIPLRESLN